MSKRAQRPVFLVLLSLFVPSSTYFLGSSPLSGQAIRGTVIDRETGGPVMGANVILLDSRQTPAQGVLTDEEGSFLMVAPWTGRFRVQCERIGYGTALSSELDLLPPDTLDIQLSISVEAVVLDPLTIISEREPMVLEPRLARWGYYDRVAQFKTEGTGKAHFLDYEEIRKRNPGRASDMFSALSGVRVVHTGVRGVRIRTSRPALKPTVRREGGGIFQAAGINNTNQGCGMTFYLDGMKIRLIDENESINDYVQPEHLSAIEVYVRPPYPVQYAPERFDCGSLVVWTGFVEGKGRGKG